MNNNELIELYRMNFLLAFEYNFDINILESMIPYEREIYVSMLLDHLEKKKKAKQQKGLL